MVGRGRRPSEHRHPLLQLDRYKTRNDSAKINNNIYHRFDIKPTLVLPNTIQFEHVHEDGLLLVRVSVVAVAVLRVFVQLLAVWLPVVFESQLDLVEHSVYDRMLKMSCFNLNTLEIFRSSSKYELRTAGKVC